MKAIRYILILLAGAAAADAGATNKSPETPDQTKDLVVQANNNFAVELYAKLRCRRGNIFFSPYSISTAVAMTYAGARGQTKRQMADVLHFPVGPARDSELFHRAFGEIINDLNARGRRGAYELIVADALWGQKGYGFLDEFLELIKNNYDGRLNELDFADAESARKTINTWVEDRTNNKIKNLIQKGTLGPLTRLVVTNAVYFKGNWKSRFKDEYTRDEPFTLQNAAKIDVPMMHQTEHFKYAENDHLRILEMPYVDEQLSMIILLPDKFDGLSDLEKTLTAGSLSKWLGKLQKREVIVSIPRFKMTGQISLAETLRSMGMTDAFSPSKADFSAITGKKDLFISAIVQKAFVDVNEEGTEAAAATGTVMKAVSVVPRPVFRADHPFIFIIRDNLSGSFLFLGRVMNPKPQAGA